MRVYQNMTFADMVGRLLEDFLRAARRVDVAQWQGRDVKGDPSKVTWELREAVLSLRMPNAMIAAQREYTPNLPWAEDHFQERVGGEPLNPPPSSAWWPFAQADHKDYVNGGGQFSHTYPERFWPRFANVGETRPNGRQVFVPHNGIRFEYGDLGDVIQRLVKDPYTRQAYLPVWFPEDTGAPEGERVPCTLGYHFMVRDGKVHVTYHIRACDFMRHFRDDVYLAVRLGQWVRDQLEPHVAVLDMGELTMHIGSFHIFHGDLDMVRYLVKQARTDRDDRIRKALG